MPLIPYFKTNFIKTTDANAEQAILQRKKQKETNKNQKSKKV